MADILRLYISAASDLESERESISRSVPEIPVTLGWRVVQSPIHGDAVDMNAVTEADVHILLLGSDIRAPIGLEWQLARRANRTPVAYLRENGMRTMAALDFIRFLEDHGSWHKYKNLADLHQQVLKYLADHILAHTSYYALRSAELEKLTAWRKKLETPEKGIPELHGGIGESSVVLSPERYIPSSGVLIQEKPGAGKKKRASSG
jgi:hypothetical protein